MDINTAAIEWLENEGCPPPVLKMEHLRGMPNVKWAQAKREYRERVEAWMHRYEEAGLRPPQMVMHHALIEDFDIDPVDDDGDDTWESYAPWVASQLPRYYVETRWVYPDQTVDALGPSYSQAYADKHQSEVRDVPCAGAEGSGGSAGGPGKCGQNDGGHFPSADRRAGRDEGEDEEAGSSRPALPVRATAAHNSPGALRITWVARQPGEVPEGDRERVVGTD